MPTTPNVLDVADGLSVDPRRWIDLLVIASGAACAWFWPAAGAVVIAVGLASPVVQWTTRRRSAEHVSHLVPQEVALAHRDVVEATRLAGVVDGDAIVEAADDLMLEVAAVLTGRPVKGAAQRRFVDARASALTATAAELRERHQLWTEAQAEVDSISGLTLPDRTEEAHTTGGPVVALLVVVLFPMFFSWDVVVVIGRALLALVDGLALRLRMIARLALLATQGALAFLARAREVWTYLRTTLLEAALEAHHRSSSVRLRLRLQVRRARRRVRLLRAG